MNIINSYLKTKQKLEKRGNTKSDVNHHVVSIIHSNKEDGVPVIEEVGNGCDGNTDRKFVTRIRTTQPNH